MPASGRGKIREPAATSSGSSVVFYSPEPGVSYPLLTRTSNFKGLLWAGGAVLCVFAFPLFLSILAQGVIAVGWLFAGQPGQISDYTRAALDYQLPIGLLANNLALILTVLIPLAIMVALFRIKPRWLISVLGAVRWRYFAICLLVAIPIFGALLAITVAMTPQIAVRPGPDWIAFLLIIILTSPLQAVAEEITFRGFLAQTLGALAKSGLVSVVGPALIFALFHGQQSVENFVSRFGFGLIMGFLVWRTGGLEAASAGHIVNNVFVLVFTVLTSSAAAAKQIELTWLGAILALLGYAIFALCSWLIAKKMNVQTRTAQVRE